MKLRNKKTGEIVVFGEGIVDLQEIGCKNVAEMIEQGWEDYEEPKTFWFIDEEGIIRNTNDENWPEESVGAAKSLGNYFETKEEAKKAVEKLKAWKRLEDKGFHWLWVNSTPDGNSVDFYIRDWDKEATRDLEFIFEQDNI